MWVHPGVNDTRLRLGVAGGDSRGIDAWRDDGGVRAGDNVGRDDAGVRAGGNVGRDDAGVRAGGNVGGGDGGVRAGGNVGRDDAGVWAGDNVAGDDGGAWAGDNVAGDDGGVRAGGNVGGGDGGVRAGGNVGGGDGGVRSGGNGGRDEVLDGLLGAGARIRSGDEAPAGCVLVGGIGLPWLSDLDFGTNWLVRAAQLSWPAHVVLEDLSYAAHRVMHRLLELEPRRVVLIGCMPRRIDPAGTIRRYVLGDTEPPDDAEVHDRLAEAVGGVIDLDHTLAVCRHWGVLRAHTVVIEVEPAECNFGWGFSVAVEEAVGEVLALVQREVAS